MPASNHRVTAAIRRYRRIGRPAVPELLESRRLLSSSPSDFEQYMLELINRARANPAAEATRLGIDLNEGLAAGTIPNAPVAPLAFNPDLVQAAQDYTATLLGAYNYFDHGFAGTTPQSRMAAAGYVFSGGFTNSEGLYATSLPIGHGHTPLTVTSAATATQYQSLFLDSGASSRGDRLNMLDANFKEIGLGIMSSSTYQGLDVSPDMTENSAVLTTQDFAASGADPNPFLTGVVYADLTQDQFYAPGDGIGNATITATRASDGMTFTTTSFSSGGYSLAVPAGTYNVVATGAGLASPITQSNVVVAAQNVAADFLVPSSVAPGASIGGLDPSFGVGGLASHNVGFTSTSDVLLQPDGKSVIVGTGGASPSETFGVTRYNADGSLDSTFGAAGSILTSVGRGDDQAVAGALLADGDILVAGTATTFANGQAAGSQFALAEFTPAGALDTSFGGGAGYVLTSFSATAGTLSNDVAHAIVVSPTGEIFVAGSSDAAGKSQDFAIAAYNADGSAATSFGGTGKVQLDFSGGDDSIAAVALQPKGSIVAVGSSSSGGVESVALARFLSSGALDAHFGAGGKIVTSVRGIADSASSVAVTPKTGSLVVGGFSATGSASDGSLSSDFLVLRYTSSGKLDKTFHGNGMEITSFGQPAAVTRVLLESDGSILATGKSTTSLSSIVPSELSLALAKYTASGVPDTGFNMTGQELVSLAAPASQSLTPASIQRSETLTPFDVATDLMQAFNQLTQSDQGVAAVTSGGELFGVGNSGANTVEAAIVTAGLDLAEALVGALPQSVVGGGKGTISIQVTEKGTELASGTFTIQLFTSPGGPVPSGQAPFASVPTKLKLKGGQMKILHLKFAFPSSLSNGLYNVVATLVSGGVRDLNLGNNTAIGSAPVEIAAPFVDLTGSGLIAPAFAGTAATFVSFTATNNGNVATPPATSSVQFMASVDGALADAIPVATLPFKPNLKASTSRVFKVKLALPATLPTGSYFLLAVLDPSNVLNDVNTSNNLIVSGNMFVVG